MKVEEEEEGCTFWGYLGRVWMVSKVCWGQPKCVLYRQKVVLISFNHMISY